MEDHDIDTLLERYLHLLHEYTSLRADLSSLQKGMYQNIARANFTAERGMRFGQDHFDERMQASRRLVSADNGEGKACFHVVRQDPPVDRPSDEDTQRALDADKASPAREGMTEEKQVVGEESITKKSKRDDPLRWFGMLTPMPLRQAQSQSVQVVESIIPKLVSVDAEMQRVEIEVRRARKKRAKAEALERKHHETIPCEETTVT